MMFPLRGEITALSGLIYDSITALLNLGMKFKN